MIIEQIPKASVIMSAYNGEKYLKEAIESILNQTFKDFEFIIVNDGSTKETADILESYAKNDLRIKVIVNPENIGLTKSLNRAIQETNGTYIVRMDSDDISLPERLEKQIEFMNNNPEIGLLGTGYYEINHDGIILGKTVFPSTDKELKRLLIKYNPFCHTSVIIRRKILDQIGVYNELIKKAQDYDLWFRIASRSRMANLSEPLVLRRYGTKNISTTDENEQLKWALKVRKNAIKKGQYPMWNSIYLIRPYIALKTPLKMRKFLRKYLLRSKIYG